MSSDACVVKGMRSDAYLCICIIVYDCVCLLMDINFVCVSNNTLCLNKCLTLYSACVIDSCYSVLHS